MGKVLTRSLALLQLLVQLDSAAESRRSARSIEAPRPHSAEYLTARLHRSRAAPSHTYPCFLKGLYPIKGSPQHSIAQIPSPPISSEPGETNTSVIKGVFFSSVKYPAELKGYSGIIPHLKDDIAFLYIL